MDIKAYLDSIKGKHVSVLGIGVSNTPLITLLAQNGIQVTAHDRKTREDLGDSAVRLEAMGVTLKLGSGYLDLVEGDIIFRSPGIRPDIAPLLEAAGRGAVITSEMEVFMDVCPCTVIAVTGSDGKTTTTTIIYELLKAAGKTVFVGGNIGTPLLDRAHEMTENDFCVLELSSFQLQTMKKSPHVAVITNITPNHLDWHTGMEEYIAAKENIFLHQEAKDILVTNRSNAITAECAKKARGAVRFFCGEDACVKDYRLMVGGAPVIDIDQIKLPGAHNVENYMTAFLAVKDYVPLPVMAEVARSFAGVEHRLELVRELDGVKYYNDSIGSSPTRTVAGLKCFDKKVILLAGGYDKQIPFDELGAAAIDRVRLLLLCGDTAEKIEKSVRAQPEYSEAVLPILRFDDYGEMIKAARAFAQPGDVVLLSPACASFDRFPNFMVRGLFFKNIVNNF